MDTVRRTAPPTPLMVVAFLIRCGLQCNVFLQGRRKFARAFVQALTMRFAAVAFANSLKIDPPGTAELLALVGLLHTFQEIHGRFVARV
jgi:hypothetical protein